MKKNLTILFFALSLTVLSAVFFSAYAAEIIESGECGENLTWTLDAEGTLTISGSGDMTEYSNSDLVPWYTLQASIKKIVIKNGVTSVGRYSFNKHTSLTEVVLPNSITTIGEASFGLCTQLKEIVLPDSIKEIKKSAFIGSGLEQIQINEGTTNIGKQAFSMCKSLFSVALPSTLTRIEAGAFSYCTALTAVNITDLESWCNLYFHQYDSNPLYYAHDLYLNGEKIDTLTIPDTIKSISQNAFYGSSIKSVNIPKSVNYIGSYAFYECSLLEEVHISDLEAWCKISFNNRLSNPLYYAHDLYLNGEKITNLVIPDTITNIPKYTFLECSFNNITISKNLTSIDHQAFHWCSNLTDVYYEGTEAQWNNILIGSENTHLTDATIHYLGETSGETMLDENFNEVKIPEEALVVAIFRKNATGNIIEEEAYGINFDGTDYPGAVEVPVDGIWVIKLVDPNQNILTVGQKYTYSVFTNGETIADNLTYTVK